MPANASLITFNGYTLDTDTDIVTSKDLEWLQWDVTIGESIDSALLSDGQFNGVRYGAGWRLATNAEMPRLFDAFGFVSGPNEDNAYSTFLPYVPDSDDTNFSRFISLFGITNEISGGRYGTGLNSVQSSYAFFGSDANGNGLFNLASVNDDFILDGNERVYSAFTTFDGYGRDVATVSFKSGVALVRATSVNEPSNFALSIVGLLILIRMRVSSFRNEKAQLS